MKGNYPMLKTISEISSEYALHRCTINKAINRGHLRECIHKSGKIWMIDTDHATFQKWLKRCLIKKLGGEQSPQPDGTEGVLKTLEEISKEFQLNQFTLHGAARRGHIGAFKQEGKWVVNPENALFQHWLQEHGSQKRVVGERRKRAKQEQRVLEIGENSS